MCPENEGIRSEMAGGGPPSRLRTKPGQDQTTPLGKSSGAIGLEVLSIGEAALLSEMVWDGGMDGDEFLQTSHTPG